MSKENAKPEVVGTQPIEATTPTLSAINEASEGEVVKDTAAEKAEADKAKADAKKAEEKAKADAKKAEEKAKVGKAAVEKAEAEAKKAAIEAAVAASEEDEASAKEGEEITRGSVLHKLTLEEKLAQRNLEHASVSLQELIRQRQQTAFSSKPSLSLMIRRRQSGMK